MTRFPLATLALSILATSMADVNAAPAAITEGPYVGVAIGRGSLRTRDLGLPITDADDRGVAGKLVGGFRFDEHFGAEAGWVRLGAFSETVDVGGNAVRQSARARSFYLAATGRLPLTDGIALTGKAGVSFGKVSGTSVLPASSSLIGSHRSAMWGVGTEYALSPTTTLTAEFEDLGKVSDKVRANLISVGVRYAF
ncbi:MAG: porin family protein [Piscinibacter sp.]|nr:porin family protein [Piscinibacter sp.]